MKLKNSALTLLSVSSSTCASDSFENQVFISLNQSISAYGEKIEQCEQIAKDNKPDAETLAFAKTNHDLLRPILPFLSQRSFEDCVLQEKQQLAYKLLVAKHNSTRASTLKLVQVTEKLTFSIIPNSIEKFEALRRQDQEYILNNPFFSKPFNALRFYEQLVDG
ncbi:TPA: hypothetical protein KDZ67_001435 [Vibrio parahaemolyticus]|nr:hypothetical protein [Vibrio parahaemolyticus]